MPFLQTFARRALLAALTILPLPALGEVTARVDATTGDVRVIGLQAAAIKAALAEPDRL